MNFENLTIPERTKLLKLYKEEKACENRKPHPLFLPLYESDKRYFFLTGGRSSLKSTEAQKLAINLTREKGHGVLFTRWTMTSAEKSIIPEFENVLNRMEYAHEYDITKNVVTHKESGSKIIFSGIKTSSGTQTANLKSLSGITTWIIDEGEDYQDEKSFNAIDDSIRTKGQQNRIVWIQNPTTREHIAYKRWIEPKSKKIEVYGYDVTVSDLDYVEHIHSTYHLAGQYIDDSWKAKMQRYKDIADSIEDRADRHKTHYYNNYIGGWLEVAEGVILENWCEGEFDTSLPYCYGMDFGYSPDPTTLVKVAVNKKAKKIYIEEKMYDIKLGINDIYYRSFEEINHEDDLIVADSAEPREIYDLEEMGLNMEPARKGPGSIKAGLKKMEEYKIIVCGESNNAKIELRNYVWNNKKAGIPIDAYNHIIDPVRYAFDYLAGDYNNGSLEVEVH